MSINIPITSIVNHPPLGILSREIIPGIFTGEGDLRRRTGAPPPWDNVNAFGLTWSPFTVPAGVGQIQLGTPSVFDRTIVQLAAIFTDRDGHDVVVDWIDSRTEQHYWMFSEPGPSFVHYVISPGVSLVFYWLTWHL